jgi:hypothetical protein
MGRFQDDADTDRIIPSSSASATESSEDEIEIMMDQDRTSSMGKRAANLLDVENEPAEFIRGDVDVKTQMDRTTRTMRLQLEGVRDNTLPGLQTHGIEEAAAATDRDLAMKRAQNGKRSSKTSKRKNM